MGLFKALAYIGIAFLVLFILAAMFLPVWVWIVLLVVFIIFILLCVFTPLGPAIVAGLGMAAEAGAAAAEVAVEAKAISGAAKGGKVEEVLPEEEAKRKYGDVGAKVIGGSAKASDSDAVGVLKSAYPSPSTPLNIGGLLKTLALVGILGAAAFYLLGVLGLQTWGGVLGVLLIFLLVLWYHINPRLVGEIFKVLGLVAMGVGGFVFLALLPGKSTYIFVSIFLVFYLLGLLVIAGAARGFFVIFILAIVGFASFSQYPQLFKEGSPVYSAVVGQKQSWSDLVGGVKTGVKTAQTGIQRQILVATGEYEEGVEAQSAKPLGVFLEKIGTTADKVKEDGIIDIYASLRAESFKTDKPIDIKVKCCKSRPDGCAESEGDIRPSDSFTLEQYEQIDVDCIIDAHKLGVGAHSIQVEALFDFTTDAFLKAYFMEQETIRAYKRQQVDPLDAFKITEKNPVAVFTQGPLRVGMGVGQQPVALVAQADYGPTLGITFDRNWPEGELVELKSLRFVAPPGIRMTDISGKKLDAYCSESKGEQVCNIPKSVIEEILPKSELKTLPKTVRVQTKVGSIETILSQAPLAIRSFKVSVDYSYVTRKQAGVTVLPLVKA